MTVKITSRNYQTAPDGKYSLGGGLLLHVRAGSRLWLYRYQKDKKRKQLSIGSAFSMTLSEAKAKANDLTAKRNRGEDIDEMQPDKCPTFAEFYADAVETIAGVKRWKNAKHASQWVNTLKTYAVPVIGRIKLSDITTDDVLRILTPIWSTKIETASRVRGRLEQVFRLAVLQGYMQNNPATWKDRISLFLPPPAKVRRVSHHMAMTLEETKTFCNHLSTSQYMGSKCFLFGILTAARVNEFIKARWEEIDIENAVWTIPGERMKSGIEHRVPLSKQAIDLLESLPHDASLVFYSKNQMPFSIDMPRMKLRKFFPKERPVTCHGCRSTFRDWCAENLIHPDLAEKSLAHVIGTKVTQAYYRTDLLDKRRPVMQEWADTVLPM